MNKPYSHDELEQKRNYEAGRKAMKQADPERQRHPEPQHAPRPATGKRKPAERHH
ncbi:hypothetical protein [Cognatilysobacter segetis]|uniref:hypothetical protein n=1 Tax=Cognatilysobacter segetis TaxID=2492394 RepID=UPI0013900DBC|nr:hypothetical protein [Lysobacter segetis]